MTGGERSADELPIDDPASEPPVDDPRPDGLRRAESLVLVHTGDGKGKSSAAFGVLMRSIARGWPVAVVQFVKSGSWNVGEEKVARELGADWWTLGSGFTWDSTDLTEDQAVARAAWVHAAVLLAAGSHRLIVLDEITYPMNWGWIETDDVVRTIVARSSKVNVVATGRDAPPSLIAIADTATEMRNLKHAYDSGIRAMKGIDY
jgi:cob(I)alamin adenosyltransferase